MEFLHKITKYLYLLESESIIRRNSPSSYAPVSFQLHEPVIFALLQKLIENILVVKQEGNIHSTSVLRVYWVGVEALALVDSLIYQVRFQLTLLIAPLKPSFGQQVFIKQSAHIYAESRRRVVHRVVLSVDFPVAKRRSAFSFRMLNQMVLDNDDGNSCRPHVFLGSCEDYVM